ncbi:hypothetical protein AB0D38_00030 [Streptomyces sp. NPDC048279]|uniref:hypothetical protein n=1 Tax=Streptomyces sp. NPDC048279 TaxID=3154714 RepID=UPI0034140DC4
MVTPRFDYICRSFVQGMLDKACAYRELELDAHQKARLKDSINVDVRKLGDMLIPDARYPRISVTAAEKAAAIGADLRQQTWHSQKRTFDPKRAVFHYEHMTPVAQTVSALIVADSAEKVLQIVSGLRLAWITKEEDARLTALGYRHKRPDPDAAYAEAGITLLPPLPDPDRDR